MKIILKTGLFIYFLCLPFLGFAQETPATFREPRFHTTTANNISGNLTTVDLPQDIYTYSRDNRFALIIKPNPGQKSANPNPVGVWLDIYNRFAWCIYNENGKPMPTGVPFVYWLMPLGDNVIRVSPGKDGKCIIDHPLSNNNPNAKIYATHQFPTVAGSQSQSKYYNNSDLVVAYNSNLGKWELKNQDQTPLASDPLGSYNVFISPNTSANDQIGEVVDNNPGNIAVVAPPSASVATSTGYSDPTLNAHLRARNDRATLQYLSTLSMEQRIKIQIQSSTLMNTVCRRLKRGSETDKDGDGHFAWDIGGDDCDDWNYLVHPSARETCAKDSILQLDGTTIIWMPSLLDEDCNPFTIVHVNPNMPGSVQEPSESDRDGDGIASCECFNFGFGSLPQNAYSTTSDAIQKKWENIILMPLKKESSGADFLTHGVDCDDTNPAIVKNSQKCMGENRVAICVKGKWEVKDCRKCVTQPNGTGLVTEW